MTLVRLALRSGELHEMGEVGEGHPGSQPGLPQHGRIPGLSGLVGEAAPFQKIIQQIPAIARHHAIVLLTGETGTGKELVARAIHYGGERAAYPFVPVNCGALPDSLLEGELFGHERGAYTDARARRAGLLAQADKGTLFLDEVESLSLHAQVVLLRVLQDRTYRELGSSVERTSNVRFIAATNMALPELVKKGRFRKDLYYRLRVLTLNLPPLRERRQDILRLARHFLEKHALPHQPPAGFQPVALAALTAYEWPGNVRELENAIIRAINVAQGRAIAPVDLGLPVADAPSESPLPASEAPRRLKELKQSVISAFERDYLTQLLKAHEGNVSQAARAAGKERREFGKLLKKYDLHPKDYASSA